MSFPLSAPPSEPQSRGHFYWALMGTLSLGFNTPSLRESTVRYPACHLREERDHGQVRRLQGRPSNRANDTELRWRVLDLIRESYNDYGPTPSRPPRSLQFLPVQTRQQHRTKPDPPPVLVLLQAYRLTRQHLTEKNRPVDKPGHALPFIASQPLLDSRTIRYPCAGVDLLPMSSGRTEDELAIPAPPAAAAGRQSDLTPALAGKNLEEQVPAAVLPDHEGVGDEGQARIGDYFPADENRVAKGRDGERSGEQNRRRRSGSTTSSFLETGSRAAYFTTGC